METKKRNKLHTRKSVKNIVEEIEDDTTSTKQKLFEFRGKLYAVGSILMVGSDPYYVDTSKKNNNRLIEKNKKVSKAQSRLLYKIGYKASEEFEEEEEEVDEDEVSVEERNEDDEDGENQEEKVVKKKVTESSVKKMSKQELITELSDYNIVVKRSSTLAELRSTLTNLIKKKAKKFEGEEVDYRLEEVDTLPSGPLLNIALELGLSKKDLKRTALGQYRVKYGNISNIEVNYKFYNQFIVVDGGEKGLRLEEYNLNRFRLPKTSEVGMVNFDDGYTDFYFKPQTKILDLDIFPPVVPSKYNPIHDELPSHSTKLKIGDYVNFVVLVDNKIKPIEGIIVGYNNKFIIRELKTNIKWEIPYDDMTIKHVNIGYGKHYKLTTRITQVALNEFLYERISDTTRRHTVNLLFETLSEFIPEIYRNNDEQVTNNEKDEKVNWELINQPLKSWQEYYGEQFRNWLFKKMYPLLYSKLPDFDIPEIINVLLDKLINAFGDDLFDNDGEFMLNKMLSVMTDDVFFVFVRSKLYNYGHENLRGLNSSSLALLISNIIDGYLIHRSIPQVEYELKEEWISNEFLVYIPTNDDHLEFDKEFLSSLHELYLDYDHAWKLSFKKSALKKTQKKKHNQQQVEHSSSFNGKLLTPKGKKILEDVGFLEQNIYEISLTRNGYDGSLKTSTGASGLNFDYLRNVVELLMYLDPIDNVGKYAKYLRSKIVSGIFDVRTLCNLTNIEKFPEFFINNDLNNDKVLIGQKQLDYEVYNKMVAHINLWFFDVNQHLSEQKFPWKKYTKLVALNCKAVRIRKDLEFKGLEHNSENYDCHEIAEDLYSCVAKVEPIPDEDIIISYDKHTQKFICNSLNDILYALKDQDNNKEAINPIGEKPYDLEFLESMRNRYSNLLKTELPERSVLSFMTNRENLEFYWLFNGYNGTPRIPVKRTKQIRTSGNKTIDNLSTKSSLTLSTALDGVTDGQTLCIIFKPKDIPLETFKESYAPLVKLNKIKVVIIESDGSNYDSMVSDLRKQKIINKSDVPIWIMVPSEDEPSIVYRKEIKKQNITIQKKFQQALKKV